MNIYTLLLFFLFFLWGCNNQPQKLCDSTLPILDYNQEYPEKKIDIHEIADIEYIPLETTEESVITTGWQNYISDEYIITKDIDRVHVFNRNGKHVHSFDHTGSGPNEYYHISELCVDFNKKEIYISDTKKIQVYSFTGEWIRTICSIPKGIIPEFTYNYNKQYLITHNVFHDYFNIEKLPVDKKPYYLIDKETGKFTPLPLAVEKRVSRVVKKEIKNISENVAQRIVEKILIEPILANGSEILIADFGLDTLFSYKNGLLTPITVQYPSVHNSNPPIVIAPYFYTDQFFIFKPIEMKYEPKYVLKPMDDAPLMMWNRKNNNLYRIKLFDSKRPEKNINWSMKRVQFDNPNHVRLLYAADQLYEEYQEGKLKGELKEIASRLKEDDNWVMVICKIKND